MIWTNRAAPRFDTLDSQLLAEAATGGALSGLATTNSFDAYLRRTNVATFNGGTQLSADGYGYDLAGRLNFANDGTFSASYAFLANSPLISQITLKSNTTVRLTTTKQYDLLNRLTSISSAGSGSSPSQLSFAYRYNDANQRTRVDLLDGSYWVYQYDVLGQVTGGKRYWNDGTPVAGEQFGYGFDDIGNRTTTQAGGNSAGTGLRTANYTANSVNQITQRDVPGTVDVIGAATATATNVNVNDQLAYRRGEFYDVVLSINNSSAAQWQSVTNRAVQSGTTNGTMGNLFLPKTPEVFSYDADGNLTNDGRWGYIWDGENRLLSMTGPTAGPAGSVKALAFTYDPQGRRTSKIVSNYSGGSWTRVLHEKFLYDGWNLLAALNGTNNAVLRTYLWGTDLSGTQQGAGGVGGLIEAKVLGGNVAFAAYDGNGNVGGLVDSASGSLTAQYEYGPFGEVIRCSGNAAKGNPFRFSTKYQDDESDYLYYSYRYYSASTGRWLSRDPIGERGGVNLYWMVGNNPVTRLDFQGLVDAGDVIPGWWDAIWNGFDWATGHDGITDYGPDSLQSRQMSQSSIAGQLRSYFLNKNKGKLCKDWQGVSNFKTKFRVFHEVIVDGFNGTAEFVGDARGDVIAKKDLVECKILAEFHFMNTTSLRSLLYGLWPDSWNVTLPGFPFANWTQFYTWNESFYCDCCRR